ncbi:hypothetical protein ACIA8K_00065 [Catenuloplanes sp. NPDC051500]|uniref:hypothetical protein n=1 Tax=Catenuloplanes sp. NPDC051500 TaxID=3363959 RepID=UPI0037BD889A
MTSGISTVDPAQSSDGPAGAAALPLTVLPLPALSVSASAVGLSGRTPEGA